VTRSAQPGPALENKRMFTGDGKMGPMVEAGGMSEERLLADARRGDQAAFELLVARHRRDLYAHCYRILGLRS
jgi:hypothetical protein